MKTRLLSLGVAIFLNCSLCYAGPRDIKDNSSSSLSARGFSKSVKFSEPNIEELKLVTQLPDEFPQRVSGFAYDGERFWAAIYLGQGRYATLDPSTLSWKASDSDERHKIIREVAGAYQSPGGICFANGKLWVAGSYGGSFGSIDMQDWKIEHLFKERQRADRASQSYASLACDGKYLWIAWQWLQYKLPRSQTQLLLKVEPETGKVVNEYPLPAGSPADMTHGLTWDGTRLWHIKDNKLSSIDPSTGAVVAQYTLEGLKRPAGLAWQGESLWIIEFDGKVWRLPF
jgi:hypothetical protein